MNNVTETQKEVIKYLQELTNDFFGSIWVPIWAACHIRRAGAAIGLCIQICMTTDDSVLIKIA